MRAPLAAWKYVRPPDLTVTRVDAQGKQWKFCSKCKCRATNTVGIYQLSHFDSEHVDNYRRPAAGPPTTLLPATVAPPESTGSDQPTSSIAPQSNLTSVANPNPIPPGPPDVSIRDPALDHDFDEIEFTGMWCTPVEADFHADATVTCYVPEDIFLPSLPSVIERERLRVTSVHSDDDDDDDTTDDDATVPDHDDDTTAHVSFYGDLDDEDDRTVDCDYPTDDEASEASDTDPFFGDLSPEVRFDLQHPPPDDVYYDATEDLPSIVLHHGHEFFDCVSEDPPTFPLSWHRPRSVSWVYRLPLLWLFWFSALLWDTLLYFITPDPGPPVSRRVRRLRRPRTLACFPITWMIFSNCVMISLSAYQGCPPHYPIPTFTATAHHLHASSINTFHRIITLDELVVLNVDTLLQFQCLKARTVSKTFRDRKSTPPIAVSIMTETELNTFFDAYSELPRETGEHFFDSELWTLESEMPLDLLQLSTICMPSAFVDCIRVPDVELLRQDTSPSTNGPTVIQRGLSDQALSILVSDPHSLLTIAGTKQAVIFDTGASLGITFDKTDFDGPLTIPDGDLRLGGMAQGLKIEGIGPVTWIFRNADGSELIIRSQCYYVPNAKIRLLSPQRLFNKTKGMSGKFEGDEEAFSLQFDGCHRLIVDYDPRNHLPIGYATIGGISSPAINPQANLALVSDDNQNITAGHKLLLDWHARFGHLNFPAVQRILRHFPFISAKFAAASKCDLSDFRCAVCQFAKAYRRTTHGKTTHVNEERDGALKAEHLGPGARVSVDHFESRLLGRIVDSYGKPSSDKYKGGCIFVDHGTGYIHVEHQLGFSAVETIRAKQGYENMAFEHGIVIQSYLTDKGAFKANTFVQQIRDHAQQIKYCGTNAHHQNGIAERSIRTVSNMARAMLLHSSAHWKDGIDSSLWPMAVTYAAHIYNNTPNAQNLCSADLFTGSTVPRHRLRDLHTWGCPVYVLDPTLQAGQKIPRWEPRSRRGVFVGLSSTHSSEVPLVLNLSTGSITPQYHVVFDDRFTTVESITIDGTPPTHWEDLCLENTMLVPTEETTDAPVHLQDDWLTDTERALKYRDIQRQDRVRSILHPAPPTPNRQSPSAAPSTSSETLINHPEGVRPFVVTNPAGEVSLDRSSGPTQTQPSSAAPPSVTIGSDVPSPAVRRSERGNKGTFQSTRYIDENYLSFVHHTGGADSQTTHLAYLADVSTCCDTGIENVIDPRAYAAKSQRMDPDAPTFHQAMNGAFAEEYIKAMQLEVATLVQQRTWTTVPRTPDLNVLKGTWVFKLKRLPDGTPSRFKARFCARGDLQKEGIDFFDTYAPVVQWSTIRLLLSTVLTESWATRQVDYTNAFAQADLREEVYLEFPKMFGPKSGANVVLKLLKSLYGLRQAPRTFFEKLRDGLLERGYQQSTTDPCLFMKQGIMCVVYVDDTIFAGADASILEEEIRLLGVSDTEQRHTFQLRNEGEVGAFLGIQIVKTGENTFELTQTGLISKVLEAANMSDCNGVDTPTGPTPIGSDIDGPPFAEAWKYRTIIGMLMFLSANTRPDLSYAVHQAARFSHAPRHSHAVAVKRILRYLQTTKDKGMNLTPSSEQRVDCYVDSDFAGMFAVENSQDPVSVKSRTGYVILYRGSPLLWVSKLQTQIALSTMEAEYVALSQSMRDLIPIRQILQEIMETVFHAQPTIAYHAHSKAFEDVAPGTISSLSTIEQSTVYEDNHACLKFARMAQLSPRTKHIGIPYHWFRTQVLNLSIHIEPVPTTKQLADQFTKGLSLVPFQISRRILMGW